jgi:anti-anti-sigma regulatory factor
MEVRTSADGSVVVRPHGIVGSECAAELRQTLIHAVRRLRPYRLILDLADVHSLDSINVGTVVAVCDVAADDHVAVYVDNPSPLIGVQLLAAGVHHRHLRPASPGVAAEAA